MQESEQKEISKVQRIRYFENELILSTECEVVTRTLCQRHLCIVSLHANQLAHAHREGP